MKRNFKLLVLLVLLTPSFLIAQGEIEVPNPDGLIIWLTPFIVLGATWLVREVVNIIPGWATLALVTILSGATTWISNLLDASTDNWLMQFGLGLVSVFIHQFYKQLQGNPLTTK